MLLVVLLPLLVFAVAPALAIQFFYSAEDPIWATVWSASDILGYCGNIFGALLGALATMIGVRWTIRHEREIRAEDEEKHQARLISAWLDETVCESEDSSTVRRRVMTGNDSSSPVYNVIITCVGIVAAARRRWRELVRKGLYVEPWVVFDAESREDEGPRGYSEAIALAEKAGISVANSSPSFEYWILLHYVPGVLVDSPSDAERELSRDGRIFGYEKPGLPYEDLWTRYLSGAPSKAARARRAALVDDGVNERMGRPVTYVDGLVDRLAEIAGDRG